VRPDELWSRHSYAVANDWDAWYKLYKDNPIAQGCALVYSKTIPEAPVGVLKGELVDLKHNLAKVMNAPSATRSYRMAMAEAMHGLAIGGNAYLIKTRVKGSVLGYNVYTDKFIEPIPDAYGNVDYYLFKNGRDKPIPIAVEDVVHLRGFWVNPEKPWVGMSPIELATSSIDTYNEATKLMYNLYKNDAVPKTVLTTKDDLSPEQVENIKATFTKKYGGKSKGSVGVLTGEYKIERLALDLDEAAFLDTVTVLDTRICSVYGLHPIVPGTYAGIVTSLT